MFISPYVLSCLPIILSEVMGFIISAMPSNILARCDSLRHLLCEILHHRCCLVTTSARINFITNSVHKLSCRLNFTRSGRDLKTNSLKITERLPELLPLIGLVDRLNSWYPARHKQSAPLHTRAISKPCWKPTKPPSITFRSSHFQLWIDGKNLNIIEIDTVNSSRSQT